MTAQQVGDLRWGQVDRVRTQERSLLLVSFQDTISRHPLKTPQVVREGGHSASDGTSITVNHLGCEILWIVVSGRKVKTCLTMRHFSWSQMLNSCFIWWKFQHCPEKYFYLAICQHQRSHDSTALPAEARRAVTFFSPRLIKAAQLCDLHWRCRNHISLQPCTCSMIRVSATVGFRSALRRKIYPCTKITNVGHDGSALRVLAPQGKTKCNCSLYLMIFRHLIYLET